jgi:hypothetical protein
MQRVLNDQLKVVLYGYFYLEYSNYVEGGKMGPAGHVAWAET